MAEVSEAAFYSLLCDLLILYDWRVYHTFDSRRSAAGFPDLVLVRDLVIFAELKRVGEKPRPSQVEWLSDLAEAGAETYVWTIDDLDEITRILGRRPTLARGLGASERVPDGSNNSETEAESVG